MSIGRPPTSYEPASHESTIHEPTIHEPTIHETAGRETAGGPPAVRTSSGKGQTRRLLRGLRDGEAVYVVVEDPL